jgi:hypothetical protein
MLDRLILAAAMLGFAALLGLMWWYGQRTGIAVVRGPIALERTKYPRLFQIARWMFVGLTVLCVLGAIFALIGPPPSSYR